MGKLGIVSVAAIYRVTWYCISVSAAKAFGTLGSLVSESKLSSCEAEEIWVGRPRKELRLLDRQCILHIKKAALIRLLIRRATRVSVLDKYVSDLGEESPLCRKKIKGASLRRADLKTHHPSHRANFYTTIHNMKLIVARRLVHMPCPMEGHLHCSVNGKATVIPAGITGLP